MQSVCPKCGGPAEEGLCPACELQSTELIRSPDWAEVTICSVCGSQAIKGKWQLPDERSVEDMVSQAACDALWIHRDLEQPQIDISLGRRGDTRYLAKVEIEGRFQDQPVTEYREIPVRIRLVSCDRCSRIAGKYFQSTVQVRGNVSRPLSPGEMEESEKMARAMADAGYRGGDQLSFIQEIKRVKGGLDIILGSTQLGRRMARAISERFGGRILESCKLVGKKDNRDVYRSTLLIRFPRLMRGDIVSFRGSLFEVAGFDGKKTLIASLGEGKRSALGEEDAVTVAVLGNKADALRAIVITKEDKVLEIMDPETYKMVFAVRPDGLEVEPGEEVKAVRTETGFIVLK